MKAGVYVEVLDAVKELESASYDEFELLWKKLWKTRTTEETLTKEEFEAMEYFIGAIQSLGFIRGVLEAMGGEE